MKVKKSYRLIFALVYNIIAYIVIPWIVLIIGKNIVYHPIDFVRSEERRVGKEC